MAKTETERNRKKPKLQKSGTCFTIMPFGGWFDQYYETIYRPAIIAAELEPHRADDLFRPSAIVNDIWSFTREATLLLADLTNKNPNVFYELGLAHAIGKPVIMVTESMNDIPFDLRSLRIIEYDKNVPKWGDLLRGNIEKAISEVLEAPAEAVLPTFLDVRQAPRQTVNQYERDIIELKQEFDLLRREMRSLGVRDKHTSRSIRPDEAANAIKNYIMSGLPDEVILRRLVELGAPEGWVEDNIHSTRQDIGVFDSDQED